MEEYVIDGAFVRYGAEDVPLILVVTDFSMCAVPAARSHLLRPRTILAEGTLSTRTTKLSINASYSATWCTRRRIPKMRASSASRRTQSGSLRPCLPACKTQGHFNPHGRQANQEPKEL